MKEKNEELLNEAKELLLIREIEKLQKENEELRNKLAKAKEGLEEIERWSNHKFLEKPWVIASKTLAELGE